MAEDEVDGGAVGLARTASRRKMLRLALTSFGAAAVATRRAGPAQAATGANVVVGMTNNWANNDTSIVHNNTGGTSNGPALAGYRTSSTTTGVDYSENCGLLGQTDFDGEAGVIGFSGGGATAVGVDGYAFDGFGTRGHSTNGAAVGGIVDAGASGIAARFEGGRAPLLLVPATIAGPPTTQAHVVGELYVDKNGSLFICKAAGTPGTWTNVTAPAPPPAALPPSLHLVTPTRVYDSREPLPTLGPLSNGQTRTVSVADGRALTGGAVTVPNLVPAGATAIAYNLTIVNTVAQGFLTVNPGGNTTVTSSAINWYANGQVVACASVVGISAARQVTVIAGGGGATDFVIDIVGFYL